MWARVVIVYVLASPSYLAVGCCVAALMLLRRGSGRNVYVGLALAGLVMAVSLLLGIVAVLAFIVNYWPDRRVNDSDWAESIPVAGESGVVGEGDGWGGGLGGGGVRGAASGVGGLAVRFWGGSVPGPAKRALAVVFSVGLFPGLFVASWRAWDALDRPFDRLVLADQQPLPEALPTWADGTIQNFSLAVCLFAAACGLGVLWLLPTQSRARHYRWLALSGLTTPWLPALGIGVLIAFVIRFWPARRSRWPEAGGDDEAVQHGAPAEEGSAHGGETISDGGGRSEAPSRPVRWIDARPRRVRRLLAVGIVLAFVPATAVATTAALEESKVIEYNEDSELSLSLLLDPVETTSADPELESVYHAMLYLVWFVWGASMLGSVALLLAVLRSLNHRARRYKTTAMTALYLGIAMHLWWLVDGLGGSSATAQLVWFLL
ncbi:MAG: hypothetical protein OXG47_06595 [bacterium]|nr:hypothetical protein [bacterium]